MRLINNWKQILWDAQVEAASLAVFRIAFGGIMFISVLRFWMNGWIEEFYIHPQFFFTYYGFEWVKPFPATGLYAVFILMGIAALGILLGYRYRLSAILFFLCFGYVELLDKTYYLNHYYFVSLISFLLILVPAAATFSLDSFLKPRKAFDTVPAWTVNIFRLQLGIVYFFAGIAKLNSEWLFDAQPMSIWLPAKADLPLIGFLLQYDFTAYIFAWSGAVFDLSIPFLLSYKKTRPYAYVGVIVFHVLTRILFPIGMFPWIMILSTLIFFTGESHRKWIDFIRNKLRITQVSPRPLPLTPGSLSLAPYSLLLAPFFLLQLLLPFRYLAYPGYLFWTEEGYRFSWRVMLMEKSGFSIFKVKDSSTGKEGEVYPGDYLSAYQEKMMSTQPDMILEFAHFIRDEYERKGISNPEVRAEVFVNLNGRGSRPFTNAAINLAEVEESFATKTWLLPFEEEFHNQETACSQPVGNKTF